MFSRLLKKTTILIIILLVISVGSFFYFPMTVDGETAFEKTRSYFDGLPDLYIKDFSYVTSDFGGFFEAEICNKGRTIKGESSLLKQIHIWFDIDSAGSHSAYTSIFLSDTKNMPRKSCQIITTRSLNVLYPNWTTDLTYPVTAYVDYAPCIQAINCPRHPDFDKHDFIELIDEKDESNNALTKSISLNLAPGIATRRDHLVPQYKEDYATLLGRSPYITDIALKESIREKYILPLIKEYEISEPYYVDYLIEYIAQGVDPLSQSLGMGERAAVINSLYRLYDGYFDLRYNSGYIISVANGKLPFETVPYLEEQSIERFKQIYNREPVIDDNKDYYVLAVMTYGLKQPGTVRSLEAETLMLARFVEVFGYLPENTFDWNTLQAMTYSDIKL